MEEKRISSIKAKMKNMKKKNRRLQGLYGNPRGGVAEGRPELGGSKKV